VAPPKVSAPKRVDLQFDEAKARQNLQEAVKALNEQMAASKTGLGFSVDKSLNTPVVTVRNTATGEVVRQIPTETVVRLAHSIDDMKGILLNAKV
jgi:flagellar protein FlaG